MFLLKNQNKLMLLHNGLEIWKFFLCIFIVVFATTKNQFKIRFMGDVYVILVFEILTL